MIDERERRLFQIGDFTLSGGKKSRFKIDCDALSDGEVKLLADLIVLRAKPFHRVMSPGGAATRLQSYISKYANPAADNTLIVDDVLTTGKTIEQQVKQITYSLGRVDPHQGFVIFARGPLPSWVKALFRYDEGPPTEDRP